MSKITEKLASVENQIEKIRLTFAPLSTKIAGLNEKIDALSEQIKSLGSEAIEIQNEIETANQGIDTACSLLSEAKNDGHELSQAHESLSAKHAEDEHLRASMTSMFGEAFQVVSRFMETAQKIGIIDKEQAGSFLASKKPELSVDADIPSVEESVEQTSEIVTELPEISEIPSVAEIAETMDAATIPEDITEETFEAVSELPEISEIPSVPEIIETTDAATIPEETFEVPAELPEIPEIHTAPEIDKLFVDTVKETTIKPDVSDFSENSMEAVLPSRPAFSQEKELVEIDDPKTALINESDLPEPKAEDVLDVADLGLPPLPDIGEVLSQPENIKTEHETAEEIASELDLSPLALETPEVQSEENISEIDEQTADQIEAMLKDMSKPIST